VNRVFVARLAGCAVFDENGDRVGRVSDVVVVRRSTGSPRVVGLVVEARGRRRVFVPIAAVETISSGQIIVTGELDLRRFEQRSEELRVIAELLGRRIDLENGGGEARIEDVAISHDTVGDWTVSQLFVRRPKTGGPFSIGKGPTAFVGWEDVVEIDEAGTDQDAEHLVGTITELLAADAASVLLDLPEKRREEVARQLPNERLADVIEEMGEDDQVELISALSDDRAAEVLDEMQPDDAADLIALLPDERKEALLDLMEPEEAEDVRALLAYDFDTAGGLMSPEPIIVSADATVAEGLALIRRHELAPAMASAVYVTLPPFEPPTGRFLGVVHFQRMLRYPPHERLGALVDPDLEPLRADASLAEVARALATYNLVCLPVVEENHRLVGVVTIDDVLDHLLPDDWRSTASESEELSTVPSVEGATNGPN